MKKILNIIIRILTIPFYVILFIDLSIIALCENIINKNSLFSKIFKEVFSKKS